MTKTENDGFQKFSQQSYIDIHCHCLPDIDDGPATMSDALALCRALTEDGIGTVIATPHQLGRFDKFNSAAKIREGVSNLNEELKSNAIALTVMPGGDVRVDERICQLIKDDEVLTLADGGRYILLELPHEILIDIERLLIDLSHMSIQAVISHPERHFMLAKEYKTLMKFIDYSAHLQITAGSLLGYFGIQAQKAAWHFLSSGWASLIATDSHSLKGRGPCMNPAFKQISAKLGEETAQLVCIENPLRLLTGKDMIPVYSIGAGRCCDETTL